MQKEYHWLLASSTDPEKLAASIKGGIGILTTVAILFGYKDLVDPIVNNVGADNAVQIAAAISGIASGVVFLFGIVRKIVVSYQK